MQDQDYRITLTVSNTPAETFYAINNVTQWWTEDLEGSSQKTDDEFTVHFGDVHVSTQKLTEVVPDKKVVWLVTESALNFIANQQEWDNTTIIFEIADNDHQTQVHFTHVGLTPEIECYNSCTKGWDYFIKGSLFKLLTEGKGTPGL